MPEQMQLVAAACRGNGASAPQPAEQDKPILLSLEGVPATPSNLERVGRRIQQLNRLLAESGMPFRLRML